MTRDTASQALLDRVTATVRGIAPGAEIILYGSRARGDHHEESDWDFLVLVDDDRDPPVLKPDIRNALFQLELEVGEPLIAITHSKEYWARPLIRATPFHRNVTAEGIHL